MKEKIRSSVKTAYSKFGLKAESIEKIVNIVEARLTALGTQEAGLEAQIALEITAFEPFVGIIQSEVDSRKVATPAAATVVAPITVEKTEVEKRMEAFMEKFEAQELKEIEIQKKAATDLKLTNAKALLEAAGCKNKKVLAIAMSMVNATDEMSEAEIKEAVLPLYNTEYKDFYGEGAIPAHASLNAVSEVQKENQAVITQSVKEYIEKDLGIKQPKK